MASVEADCGLNGNINLLISAPKELSTSPGYFLEDLVQYAHRYTHRLPIDQRLVFENLRGINSTKAGQCMTVEGLAARFGVNEKQIESLDQAAVLGIQAIMQQEKIIIDTADLDRVDGFFSAGDLISRDLA